MENTRRCLIELAQQKAFSFLWLLAAASHCLQQFFVAAAPLCRLQGFVGHYAPVLKSWYVTKFRSKSLAAYNSGNEIYWFWTVWGTFKSSVNHASPSLVYRRCNLLLSSDFFPAFFSSMWVSKQFQPFLSPNWFNTWGPPNCANSASLFFCG